MTTIDKEFSETGDASLVHVHLAFDLLKVMLGNLTAVLELSGNPSLLIEEVRVSIDKTGEVSNSYKYYKTMSD